MQVTRPFHFGRVQYGPKASLGPRSTIGFEFVRILKGRVQWTYDGKRYDVGPGHFILSQPNHVEHYRWDTKDLTRHDFIHFELGDLPPDLPPPSAWPLIKQVEAHDILHALFQHIVDLKHSGHPTARRLIGSALEQMVYAWSLQQHRFEDTGFDDFCIPVQRVLDLVFERWQTKQFTPPSMQEMVKQAEVSRSTFIRTFKQQCGDSPVRFFEKQRLCLAQLDLLQTDQNIEQIAYYLQYPNPFQFSRNFKQVFGLSPKHYRIAGADAPLIHFGFVFYKVFTKFASIRFA